MWNGNKQNSSLYKSYNRLQEIGPGMGACDFYKLNLWKVAPIWEVIESDCVPWFGNLQVSMYFLSFSRHLLGKKFTRRDLSTNWISYLSSNRMILRMMSSCREARLIVSLPVDIFNWYDPRRHSDIVWKFAMIAQRRDWHLLCFHISCVIGRLKHIVHKVSIQGVR